LTRRRLVPTVFDAVVASAPATSMVAALGLAGGGYLDGREGIAACGAVVGAFGLAVERLQSRRTRIRLRRTRADHRADLREVTRLLHELQKDLADLRDDLDGVRAERDNALIERDAAFLERETVQAERDTVLTERDAVLTERDAARAELAAALLDDPARDREPSPAATGQGAPVGLPLNLILPGQVRSPIATGGIPLLAPGPCVPVRSIAALHAVAEPATEAVTEPLPVLTAELTDALVYAAIAEADAAALTRTMERPLSAAEPATGAPEASSAQAGAGGVTGTPTLYVVRRGKHVA
jgi:hypothetical protein